MREDVLQEINNFNLFTINVSSYNYVDNLVLIGTIKVFKDNRIWLIASKNKEFTVRMAESFPDYNFDTDIFDKRLDGVADFDIIYTYVIDANLVDVIVEFALYDKPLGLYNQRVVVFEIRTAF